jgi:hypothetical protein
MCVKARQRQRDAASICIESLPPNPETLCHSKRFFSLISEYNQFFFALSFSQSTRGCVDEIIISFKLLHNKIIPMEKARFKLIIIRNMTLNFLFQSCLHIIQYQDNIFMEFQMCSVYFIGLKTLPNFA